MNHPKIEAVDFGSNHIFLLFVTVYVYASLCDFVCIASLLSFVLRLCLSVFLFFSYFSILFSACYHWWICFLVWLLSSFFLFFYYFLIFKFFILITLFSFFLSFFFSPFSSEPCGWQCLGALARCQACASEVREPSSGHWSTRDHLAPHNIKRRKLSQRSLSQR